MSPVTAVAALILLLVVGWAIAPTLFASTDPLAANPPAKLQAPSINHWLGTDYLGRDQYSRVVHATATSLGATVLAVLIACGAGVTLGVLAGGIGRWVDSVVMRIVDVLLSIPTLLLSLALITVLGFGTTNVAIAVGIPLIGAFARVTRAEVLRVRVSPYVEASFALGVRSHVVLWRHIARNSVAPVAGLAAVEFGIAVLAVSALSFLGYGVAPPTPEWGSLVSTGRDYLASAWWLTTLPGLVIIVVVLSAHRVGRAIGGRP